MEKLYHVLFDKEYRSISEAQLKDKYLNIFNSKLSDISKIVKDKYGVDNLEQYEIVIPIELKQA